MRRNLFREGFTLIELLVVIGVIAIVASIVIPVASNVRRTANAAACASNERQIVAACIAYSSANNGTLPAPILAWAGSDGSADFTTGVIWPYIGPSIQSRMVVMHCPADTLEQYCSYGSDVIPPPYRNFSYSLNIGMSSPMNTIWGLSLGRVRNPSQHVMVYEEFAPNDSLCFGPTDGDDWLTGRHGPPGSIEHRAAYQDLEWRQNGRGNVGYFDGHVASMSVAEYFSVHDTAHPTQQYYHFGPLTQ